MNPGERWHVVVHNDDHNTLLVVHHLIRTVCGASDTVARTKTMQIHRSGRAVVTEHDSRDDAEATTLNLTRLGLHATFGRV